MIPRCAQASINGSNSAADFNDWKKLTYTFGSDYLVIITLALLLKEVINYYQKRRSPSSMTRSHPPIFEGGWGIYLLYGPFYFTLLNATVVTVMEVCNSDERGFLYFLALILSAVFNMSSLFAVVFVLHLYGMKKEMLYHFGQPIIPKSEISQCINVCSRRTLIFLGMYGIVYLISFILSKNTDLMFDFYNDYSVCKLFKNALLLVLVTQRFRVVASYNFVMLQASQRERWTETLNVYRKSIDDIVPTQHEIISNIEQVDNYSDLTPWLYDRFSQAEEKISLRLNLIRKNSSEASVPLPRDYRDKSKLSKLLTYWLLIDTFLATLGYFYLAFVHTMLDEDSATQHTNGYASQVSVNVATGLLFVLYVGECTLQPILVYNILKDSRVLGEIRAPDTHMDNDSELSQSSSGNASGLDRIIKAFKFPRPEQRRHRISLETYSQPLTMAQKTRAVTDLSSMQKLSQHEDA